MNRQMEKASKSNDADLFSALNYDFHLKICMQCHNNELIKELQSLGLDIRVLDAEKNEIEIKELDDDEDDTAPSLPAGRDTEPEDLIPEESAGEGEEIEEPDDSDLDLSDDIALDDLDDLDSFELGDDIE